jgi:predicted CoA-binding protein
MTTRASIDEFMTLPAMAIVGVSRGGKKFGNQIFREMKQKGYKVYPINPNAEQVENEPCYPNLSSLPEKVQGGVIVVPPAQTEKVVQEAHAAGIHRIWLQPGAESPAAVRYCEENSLQVVTGQCILMYGGDMFMHKVHRFFAGIFGQVPR